MTKPIHRISAGTIPMLTGGPVTDKPSQATPRNTEKPKQPPPALKRNPTVAVIDFFHEKSTDLNGDFFADVPHGQVVEAHIKSYLPTARFIEKAMDKQEPVRNDSLLPDGTQLVKPSERVILAESRQRMREHLASLAKPSPENPIDAVNISLTTLQMKNNRANYFTYQDVSEAMGFPITPDNIAEHRIKLKDQMKDWAQCPAPEVLDPVQREMSNYWSTIQGLEAVTAHKIPVYIAAGNDPKTLNLYTLADGVQAVGALDDDRKHASFTSNNTLVKRFERGTFTAMPVTQYGLEIGFDVTDDGKVDFGRELVSNNVATEGLQMLGTFLRGSQFKAVNGTSFASPQALGKDLLHALRQ